MTVEKARHILGEEIVDLTDNQVVTLIQQVGGLCDGILDMFVMDKSNCHHHQDSL